MSREKRSFFSQPEPTARFDEILIGKNIADGIARIEEPLSSPLRGQNCVAYFYKGYLVMTKGRAPAAHRMKQIEVYAPFELDMEGGTVHVLPAKSAKHDSSLHLDGVRTHGPEYQATEELVLPGARLRVEGKVREESDGRLVLRMTSLAVLEKQAVRAGVVGDRKSRRKKRKPR